MTTFRSKIDAWLILTLALAIGVVIYASMQVIFNAVPRNWWPLILIIGLGIGMPVWLLISTRYILQPKLLTVRSGSFRVANSDGRNYRHHANQEPVV